MSETRESLLYIRERLKKLLDEVYALRSENKQLKERVMLLEGQLEAGKTDMEELKNKNINLQVTESLKNSPLDTVGLKKRLDAYINEIDTCIALLKGGGQAE